jgi:hypothetical protein
MKNYPKLALIVIAIMISPYARSQNEIQVAISNMKENTTTMKFVLSKIDENIKKDKHKELEKNVHDYETLVNKVKEDGSLFKDDISDEIDAKCEVLAESIVKFEKTVHASKLFDKHDELIASIVELNTNTADLRKYIDELDALSNEILRESTLVFVEKEESASDRVYDKSPGENRSRSSSHSNDIGTLKNKSDAVEIQLDGIDNAFKYNKYSDIAKYCNKIMDLCEEMGDLSNNERLSEIVKEMKDTTHDLEHLSLQGHGKHNEIHHESDHLKKLHSKLNYQLASLD